MQQQTRTDALETVMGPLARGMAAMPTLRKVVAGAALAVSLCLAGSQAALAEDDDPAYYYIHWESRTTWPNDGGYGPVASPDKYKWVRRRVWSNSSDRSITVFRYAQGAEVFPFGEKQNPESVNRFTILSKSDREEIEMVTSQRRGRLGIISCAEYWGAKPEERCPRDLDGLIAWPGYALDSGVYHILWWVSGGLLRMLTLQAAPDDRRRLLRQPVEEHSATA